MSLDDRIEHALGESAESFGTPPSQLETVIIRGRRRRLAARFVTLLGSGTALVVALAVTVSFTRAASEPEVIVGEQTPGPAIETTAREREVAGHLAEDAAGYTLTLAGSGDVIRMVEAHTAQVEGKALFGPGVSDRADGFIYTISDVVEGSDTRQGWVMWVPAGAAQPIVVADEPEAGVGQVLGVVDHDERRYAVYSTVSGRTVQLRRAPLDSAEATGGETLLDDFTTGDAAGSMIVTSDTEDGCSRLEFLDPTGSSVERVAVPVAPCPVLDQVTLSRDGTKLAYLDRTNDRNLLVVVSLGTGKLEASHELSSRERILTFDGDQVTLTGGTAIDVASNAEVDDAEPAALELRLNTRLVLQVPGRTGTLTYDEAQALTAFTATQTPGAEASPGNDLLSEYLDAGWSVDVRPDPDAAATPVDLDAYGVTLRGIGPYVIGNSIQRVADESGHDLLGNRPRLRCSTMRISPRLGVTAEDATLLVTEDRLAGIEFATNRFAFDGVTVGTSLADAIDRLADAQVRTTASQTMLVVAIDELSMAEFVATDGAIASFRVVGSESCR